MVFLSKRKTIKGMKVGIVGASAAGLYAAILLAKRHPDFHIVVLEKNDKAGKKLLATGNGHCNLFNKDFRGAHFNHPEFVDALLARYPVAALMNTLKDLGVATFEKDGLLYPLSYSAASHVRYIVTLAQSLGIDFKFGEKVIRINRNGLETDKGTYAFDHVIYAFGGQSQANLGSDGSMFPVLEKVGYHIRKMEPSLCPLLSPDVPKSLFGVRHKCVLSLTKDNKTFYQEEGEVLFKKDGLSGIAVMNASSRYQEGAVVRLDLFPEFSASELEEILRKSYHANKNEFIAVLLEKPFADYILQKCVKNCRMPLNEKDISSICALLKSLQFRISGKYGFDASQVTRGGIALEDVDLNLRSKIEPNASLIGECLDVDGLCGGFNLGWALLSAKVVTESL